MALACSSSPSSFRRIANSSPPSLASASPCRRHDSRRRDTAVSSSSPTRWPRLSLTTLKRSRSRYSTANRLPAGRALNSSSRRPRPSTNTARLHSPVSGSRNPGADGVRLSCSGRSRPSVSVSDPAMRAGRAPGASRPRRRGTGTAGRCRPRGESGARAENDPSCRRDVLRAPSLSGRDVVGMDTVNPFLGTTDAGGRRQADHRPPSARRVELLAPKIPLPQPVARRLRPRARAALRFA